MSTTTGKRKRKKNEYLNNDSFQKSIADFQRLQKFIERTKLYIEDQQKTKKLKEAYHLDISEHDKKIQEYLSGIQEVQTDFKRAEARLTEDFYTLSNNIAAYWIKKYSGIDADDAVQDAVVICFDKIDRFDPEMGRAFSYMTTCITNHFRQVYRVNKNYNELKRRYQNHLQEKYSEYQS